MGVARGGGEHEIKLGARLNGGLRRWDSSYIETTMISKADERKKRENENSGGG